MLNKKKVFYWSPFTSKVATVFSVMNSAQIINKYSNKSGIEATIIDAVNEWEVFDDEIIKKKINKISLNQKTFFNSFEKNGFLRSRFAYWYIFIKCFFSLDQLLKKQKPEYLIIHLITSLPLVLFSFKNYKTKLILRISGLPKMTFLRKLIWKIASKKIHKITCPTKATFENLSRYDFLEKKLFLLRDPVLNIDEINKKLKDKSDLPEEIKKFIDGGNFFLLIGRFTKQKNFIFFLESVIDTIKESKDLKFLIIGDGEDKKKFLKIVKEHNLRKNVFVHSYTKNVHYLMRICRAFILTSLWEDPGFVIIESAYNNCTIISSNCPNGPEEILSNDGGYLFESNSKKSFKEVFNLFVNDTPLNKLNKKIKVKKRIREFSCFNHYLKLKEILK